MGHPLWIRLATTPWCRGGGCSGVGYGGVCGGGGTLLRTPLWTTPVDHPWERSLGFHKAITLGTPLVPKPGDLPWGPTLGTHLGDLL
jgi:hypothetical protein